MPIGVDYGGTKIEGIVLDEDGTELTRKRVPTPRHDYAGSLDAIVSLVQDIEAEVGRSGEPVGLGIPGAVAPDGRVFNGNSTWLIGQPLGAELSARLDRTVRVANDANCFVLSEAIDGAGRGADIVFGAILGTGVGGGLAVHGRMVNGASGMAGEWGHSPLPISDPSEFPGPECFCGRKGCIEQWLAGPGLEADYARDCGMTPGTGPRVPEIVSRAQSGEDQAEAALQRHRRRLARALATVVNTLDPDVIVLGGGVSNLPGLAEELPELMRPHVYSTHFATRVTKAVFGDSSGVRGAARIT
ncbi:ROK family protein [Pontivivens insulae]|uniref:Fructokinase n=1 Tax=Pontivivens insulae TaxID=1639689 RepID=A0A2R8ABE4_9RHOB|nr:ROK family protein [Pontivivens insulae]RED13313.1 fructokinase [Pontivivens insulae]SPF29405.1 Fructokinase [Pontivivens insulae]